jgi:large subunit ribosomal protein L18
MTFKTTAVSPREIRHARVRRRVSGTAARPRLAVFRSNSHIYAQVIDDTAGHTLASASSGEAALKPAEGATKAKGKTSQAAAVGAAIAKRAREAGIKEVIFDRGGFKYHGRVKALADAARKEGLGF